MSDIAKSVGDVIRTIRKERGYSQEELAFKASIHPKYIGQVERGEKNITIESLEKISCALEVSIEELFQVIQPNLRRGQYSTEIIQIIDLVKTRSKKEQRQILSLLELFINWKEE